MRIEDFKLQMQQYKLARESNPSLSYWDWKINRPQDSDWKYLLWRSNLPENLRLETNDYDLYGAYKAGLLPSLEDDGFYHLGSRDPHTGRILKTKNHPTYQQAIKNEIEAGYLPYEKDGWTYTKTYAPTGDISGYSDGTDGIVDELKSNSRTTLTPEELQYLMLRSRYRQRMSGAITPVFDIRDAVDFNMSRSSDPDAGNLMFDEMKKDLSIDPNPMIPSETSYFRTGSELKSYMNTLRQFMFDNNMINKIDDKVTTKKIQEAINKLPSELNSVKAAYKQFKSPRKYTKWFNTIPLLGVTPFMLNYSEENNSN